MDTGIGNCLEAFLSSASRLIPALPESAWERYPWWNSLESQSTSKAVPHSGSATTLPSPVTSIWSEAAYLPSQVELGNALPASSNVHPCNRHSPCSPVSSLDRGATPLHALESDEPELNPRFQCRHCDAIFAAKFNLNKHVRALHERKRPHQCEECGAAFQQKDHLNCHRKSVHEKLKPYECEVCGKKFGWSGVLKKHIRIVHEKERPFPCYVCGHAFRQKAHLEKHVTTIHEKRRPFLCYQCGSAFGRKDVLVRHARTMHPEEASPTQEQVE